MIGYIVRRIAQTVPLLFGLLIFTFVLYRFVPQDPAIALAGDLATKEQVEQIRKNYGLDRPLHIQLYNYVAKIARGDLGFSYFTYRPVAQDLRDRLPATLELVSVSLLFSIFLGVPVGVAAAWYRGSVFDGALRVVSIIGLAVASFWLAIMLQILFSMHWGILPLRGRLDTGIQAPLAVTGFLTIDSLLSGRWDAFVNALRHLILPATTLALGCSSSIARFTRTGMLDALQKDFVFYAEASGYGRSRLLWIFVLRNAISSTITQIGLLFGALLVGAVVIENIFDWPGLGSYAVGAMYTSDLQPLLGVTLLIGFFCCIVNLLADLAQFLIDPRLRQRY